MILPLVLAAATPAFSVPVIDAELATCVPNAVPAIMPIPALQPALTPASALGDQVDSWWAEDGVELLAASRPLPSIPTGLDVEALRTGHLSLHLHVDVLATNR